MVAFITEGTNSWKPSSSRFGGVIRLPRTPWSNCRLSCVEQGSGLRRLEWPRAYYSIRLVPRFIQDNEGVDFRDIEARNRVNDVVIIREVLAYRNGNTANRGVLWIVYQDDSAVLEYGEGAPSHTSRGMIFVCYV